MTAPEQVHVGTDLLSINRMERILRGPAGKEMVRRTFTPDEIAESETRGHPMSYFAGRFAAKEAVFKSLGVDWTQADDPRDIEIGQTKEGAPVVRLSGHLREMADAANFTGLSVSLSYDDNWVIAVAVATRGTP
ncbi:MAG TPA: holo-ACP synthase [Dermatophilaceae bacterium]|nr:holo-ACP synthase [Dermatophilaceae bacterium]